MAADKNTSRDTILIVDDTPANLSVVMDYLCDLGATIMIARNGETGLDLARQAVPDLILLDVLLPGIDGYEVCRRLKADERTRKIPVLFMTVVGDRDSKITGFQVGGVDYITKPFHAEEVLARVKTHLTLYKLQNKLEQEIALRTEQLAQINQALKAEIAERKLLSAAVEQSGEGVLITDAQGNILYVNPAFERTTGYSSGQIVGQNLHMSDDEHPLNFFREIWQAVSDEGIWRGRTTSRKKDGSFYTQDVTISPVRDDEGHIVNYVALIRDITHQLELEAQYLQSQKMEAIGQLAGGLAHDFNNILVPIIGYAELGLKKLSPDDGPYADLEQIKKAAERAADLTHRILAFSRKQVLEVHPLNLNTLIADFGRMLRRLLHDNIELQTLAGSDLGWVQADRTQIEQVLMNLAVNAQQAMPSGGKLTIETANVFLDEQYTQKHVGVQPGPYVMLSVSDTGHGMDAETLKHIFEPFFTTKDVGKGTGLGLATVFGIVKQHGGHIWVYSEVGRGTTFKIYLPRIAKTEQDQEETQDTAAIPVSGTETVLVVEDDEMVRQLVCETLEAHGYDVIEAADPAMGLQTAADHPAPIHLLLTDVIMPQMNGPQLYRQLREIHPRVKVLYMSGYTDNAIAQHGILKENVNFVQKPFTIHALTRKVRTALDQGTAPTGRRTPEPGK